MARNPSLDLYAILGVHPSAEDIVIRAAFKALAQRYHPDRFAGSMEEAHRRMADLTNAYETLADPARRRKYDRRRGHAGRTAMFYFKNPAREHPLRFGALAARAAAAKQRRYRMAVYVLMVAVVILSAFNLHQHSAQLRELFTGNHDLPAAAADTGLRNRPDVALPEESSASPAAPGAAPAVKSQPIGPAVATRPIGQNAADATTPAVPRLEATVPADARPPVGAAKVPAQPVAAEVSKAPVAMIAAPTAAADTAHKDAKRPATKTTNTKNAPAERPAANPPAASTAVASPPAASAAVANPSGANPPVANPSVASMPASAPPVASMPASSPTAAPAPVAKDAGECKAAVAALGLCNRN